MAHAFILGTDLPHAQHIIPPLGSKGKSLVRRGSSEYRKTWTSPAFPLSRASEMRTLVFLLLGLIAIPLLADDKKADEKKIDDKVREVAGSAEVLFAVPKKFATLQGLEPARRSVTLLCEGDKEPQSWTLADDAEVKVHGWWGRLDQLTLGDRVWVWFKLDAKKKPTAVLMLADEMSQQDINGTPKQYTQSAGGKVRLSVDPAGFEEL